MKLPPSHANRSDWRFTLSWQPQVLPDGVGKQNVLHRPFLLEQLKLTRKKPTSHILIQSETTEYHKDK